MSRHSGSRNSNKHSQVELDEEFLASDHNKQSNLSLQFSDSVSLKSSTSSGSSFQQFLEISAKQQERIFENDKQIRNLYRQLLCANVNVQKFREEISNLGISESSALRKLLLNAERGADVQYTQLIKALTLVDVPEEETHSPRKVVVREATPLPSLNDVFQEENSGPVTPTKRQPVGGRGSSDVLTWSTPPPPAPTPTKKLYSIPNQNPIPVYTPPPPPFKENEVLGTAERNALAKAFLANSISSDEFKEKLTNSGLEISTFLEKLINDHNSGKMVRFFDFCKELEFLKQSKNFAPIQTLKANSHLSNATVDIFDMEHAPEKEHVHVPHSKEQIATKREQRNVFTWEDGKEEKVLPSRKIGARSYAGSFNISNLQDSLPDDGQHTPIRKKPTSTQVAADSTADFFTWSTPPKTTLPEKPIRKILRQEQNASPWGTLEDLGKDTNPHSHYLSKKHNQ